MEGLQAKPKKLNWRNIQNLGQHGKRVQCWPMTKWPHNHLKRIRFVTEQKASGNPCTWNFPMRRTPEGQGNGKNRCASDTNTSEGQRHSHSFKYAKLRARTVLDTQDDSEKEFPRSVQHRTERMQIHHTEHDLGSGGRRIVCGWQGGKNNEGSEKGPMH